MIKPTWIDDFDEADTPWLIEGIVCPSLTIISAQPKHGKTLLAGHIAISLITGQPLAGKTVTEDKHLIAWMGSGCILPVLWAITGGGLVQLQLR